MEKKEFGIKIKAMLTYNKKIHTPEGATVENIKRLNYLIIEMINKGCKAEELFEALCVGRRADKEKYDLLCRVTEQTRFPTLVYTPDVAYTDDLKNIQNVVMDETKVRSSKWASTIAKVTNVSEEQLYRFTQCYMLLEQIGREELIIDHTEAMARATKKGYLPISFIGKSFHYGPIEIDKKFEMVSKLMYCGLGDYSKLQAIGKNMMTNEDRKLVWEAYNSANLFLELSTKFEMLGTMGVQGDTNKYIFQRYRNSVPYNANKYREAYSMYDVVKETDKRCRTDFAKIGIRITTMTSEATDDTM